MSTDKSIFFLILCVWLLPIASVKLFVFGWPLYPIEIVLLASLPFFSFRNLRAAWDRPLVRAVSFFAGLLLIGTVLSYSAHPSLAGLGQVKSFFVFPIWLYFFAVSVVHNTDIPRITRHWRYMLLLVALGAIIFGLTQGFTYDHRLRAWLDSPNLLAILLLPGVIVWWSEAIVSAQQRIGVWAAWGIAMAALLLTRSYSAVSAALVSMAAFVWIMRGYVSFPSLLRRKLFLIPLVLLLVFVSVERGTDKWAMLTTLHERSSLESRMMIWKAATQMIIDQPLFGIGPARFQETYLAYQAYYPPYLEWAVPHPHNLWLAFWLSSGVLGAIALVWLAGSLILFSRPCAEGTKKSLFLAILVSFFTVGFLDVPYFRAEFCYSFWLVLALLSVSSPVMNNRD